MLEELIVQNFAIIDRLHVQFSPGLNVLTGETGAGKSILVGALGMLLGTKADAESIRSGAEELSVSGLIQVGSHPEAKDWLEAHGIAAEDGRVILRRSLRAGGKATAFIQSAPVTLASMKELASLLFDMHGQHEHQSLLSLEIQRKLLDSYGGFETEVKDFAALHSSVLDLREQAAKMTAAERERLAKVDLLGFAIREIEEARLSPGEDEQLEKERRILQNYEKLFRSLEETHRELADQGMALTCLRQAKNALDESSRIDPDLAALAQQLGNAFFEVEDAAESVRKYKGGMAYDPAKLESIEERLALIRKLKKKYGQTIGDILEHGRKSREELELLSNWEEKKEELQARLAETESALKRKADELSRRRRESAAELEGRITTELRQLGMPKAGLTIVVRDRENEAGKLTYSASGKDVVEFLLSPNLGEPPRRLALTASGGELSRVMLAIKSMLAGSDSVSTMIFDEVDTGIGGEVALAVGERLKELANRKQVLCITHLATIAVRAQTHIQVEKITRDGRTLATAEPIDGKRRREELARMLAGDRTGEVSLRHADELIRKYGA